MYMYSLLAHLLRWSADLPLCTRYEAAYYSAANTMSFAVEFYGSSTSVQQSGWHLFNHVIENFIAGAQTWKIVYIFILCGPDA